MRYQEIIYEVDDHIAFITINRPTVFNALKMSTKYEIEDAIDRVKEDLNVHGVIITGKGKGFIAGNDISEIRIDAKAEETVAMSMHAHRLFDKFDKLPKPIIAAVNGFAMGGGAELALACDLRVASTRAVFSLPEVGLGVAPCYGGTQRLPRLVGTGWAKDILFTGRRIGADEALRIGLVNRVAEPEELMTCAVELMKSIIKNAPMAVKVCKYLVNKGMDMNFEDALKLESNLNGMLAETDDAKEGVKAFFEKRAPVFNGK